MIGAVVVTPKTVPGVMVNASGFWQDADQSSLMCQNQDITNFATVSYQQMHHFAMELINRCLDGFINIIEDSGECGVLLQYGWLYFIGCTLFISEELERYLAIIEWLISLFKLSKINFI